jgi:peptidoglycan hydrolase-like protein with peptidoglycan-binding domain
MKHVIPLAAALLLSACAVPMTQTSYAPSAVEVTDAQQRLRAMGHYNGPIDGIWGPDTQLAVERYQRSRNMALTSRLDTQTVVALRAEPIPAPSPTDIRDAQQRLRALGHYQGPINGQWTAETQGAVERYQRSRAMPMTARLDANTISALRSDESARQAEERRRAQAQAQPVTISDATDVRAIQNRLRQLNLYDGPADGIWSQRTQASLEGFQRAKGLPVGQITRQTLTAMELDPNSFTNRPASRVASAALVSQPLDRAVVRGVQQRLRGQGYYAGAADGIWGPRTQSGLERFQRSHGLEATGRLDPSTAAALGMDPNNLADSAR